MRWDHRADIDNEAARHYGPADGGFTINEPVAIYTSPDRNVEGIMTKRGELFIVPKPSDTVRIVVTLLPNTDEPLLGMEDMYRSLD